MLGKSADDRRRPTDGVSGVKAGGIPGVWVEELDDPEFGTLNVNTGSSRSMVASEEADVGVMFGGEVDITGLASGRCEEINTDARIASTVCRWSVQGAAVVKRSESLELADSRCYVSPKDAAL